MARSDEDSQTTVIKWSWRHHSLLADLFDSVQEAVAAAKYAGDDGGEALQCIEVITDGTSRVLTPEEVQAIRQPMDDAEDAKYRARPPAVAYVRLTGPGIPSSAVYDGFASIEDAERVAERFRRLLGSDRVVIDKLAAAQNA